MRATVASIPRSLILALCLLAALAVAVLAARGFLAHPLAHAGAMHYHGRHPG